MGNESAVEERAREQVGDELRIRVEWAYAGVMITMTGAAASNAAAHQFSGMIAAAAFAVLALTSWAIRPGNRRL